jgi:hypothetical protein
MPTIPHNEENSAKMRAVAEYLTGTCQSLDAALEGEFGEDVSLTDFDTTLLHELDDMTMVCEDCIWWYETHELNDDQKCSDCAPSEDDDENED